MERYSNTSNDWRSKGSRFVKYLTTRHPECWGFFAAGIVIAKIHGYFFPHGRYHKLKPELDDR